MWCLVDREAGAAFPRLGDERARDTLAFRRASIGLLDGADHKGANGGAGLLRAQAKRGVHGFGDVDGGTDRHTVILSLAT